MRDGIHKCEYRDLCIRLFDRAEALQSILQLMGEKEMFEYWSQTYRVHNLEWSQEKAANILRAWQSKFTQVRSLFSSLPCLIYTVKSTLNSCVQHWYYFWICVGGTAPCSVIQRDTQLQDTPVLVRFAGEYFDRILGTEHRPCFGRLRAHVGLRRSIAR